MAEIVDLSSLIRGDDPLVDTESLDHSSHASEPAGETGMPDLPGSSEGLLQFTSPHSSRGAIQPDASLDWSNQELADLYRVQRLLGQAGIGVETDRGVSDEGDPWFVYLDARGEVFVHLSRIDGVYVLDSAVQDHVVTGHCFSTLIEGFAGRAESAAAVRPEGNVISMNRRGKIVLHPGAALAALVWSVLLVSDELVFLEGADAQDANDDQADAIALTDGSDAPAPDEDQGGETGTNAFEELFASKEDAEAFLAEAVTNRDGEKASPGDVRDSANAASPATMAGIGLTALAAAYGINSTQAREEPPLADDMDAIVATSHDGSATTAETSEGEDLADQAKERNVTAGAAIDAASLDTATEEKADDPDPEKTQYVALSDALIGASDATVTEAAVTVSDVGTEEQVTGLPSTSNPRIDPNDAGADSSTDAATSRGGPEAPTTVGRLTEILESVGLKDIIEIEAERFDSAVNHLIETADDFLRLLDTVALADVVYDENNQPGILVASAGSFPGTGDDLNLASGAGLDGTLPADSSGSGDPYAPPALAGGGSGLTTSPLNPGPGGAQPSPGEPAPTTPISAAGPEDPTVIVTPPASQTPSPPTKVSAPPAAPQPEPEPELQYAEFNDDVRDYIDHMILTSEVEIIELEDQILVIDTKALSEGGEAFARSWSLDAEMTVSTIGVRSDFEAFDLIA